MLRRAGWTRVAFGDVVQLVRERSSDPEGDGFERYVGLEHIDPGDLRIRRWGNVSDGTTFTNVFRAGQVLFGKRRAYQRKVAVADFDGICSGDIYVLEPKGDGLLPELLPFICQTDRFFEHAVGTSAGSLSPRTNWTSLAAYEFHLPPLDEQRRVVRMLDAWVLAGNKHLRAVAVARAVRASALRTYFGNGGASATSHGNHGSRLLSASVRTRLADISRVVRGSTPRPAQDPRFFGGSFVPWITVGEVTKDDSPFLSATETMLTEEGSRHSRLLRKGTLVLTNSGFSLGVPKILAIDGCANDGIAAFEDLDTRVVPQFLYYRLLSLTDHFRKVVAAGGDQPNLNTTRIGEIDMLLPDTQTQHHVAMILRAADDSIVVARRRAGEVRDVFERSLSAALAGPWREQAK